MKNKFKLKIIAISAISMMTIFTINSCKKSNPLIENETNVELEPSLIEKSGSANLSLVYTSNYGTSDAFLIQAIHGNDPEFLNVHKLELLLLERTPLSNNVLNQVILENRIPNETVELLAILSSPFKNNSAMNLLQNHRPQINLSSIIAAQNLTSDLKCFVVNSNPKQLIFSTELTRTNVPNTECSSLITGKENSIQIGLTSTDLEPEAINSIPCDQAKGPCGYASSWKYVGHNQWVVTCTPTVNVPCLNLNVWADK